MVDLLIKLGGIQALLFAGMLFARRVYSRANRFLGALVLLAGLLSFFYTIESTTLYAHYPFLIRLEWGILLLVGPLLWFYAQYVMKPGFQFVSRHLWHFLPYLINISILMPFFISPAEDKIQVLDYFSTFPSLGTDDYRFYFLILSVATSISGIIYSFKVLAQVMRFQKKLEDEYADRRSKKITWLYFLSSSLLLLFFIYLVLNVFTQINWSPDFRFDAYFYIGLFFLIYAITYKALHQPEILTSQPIPAETSYLLDLPEREKLTGKLTRLMKEEKIYLNPELTASEMADSMDISRQKLSELLNEHLDTSFYNFVNSYRVKTFKNKLRGGEYGELSLLGIAYEAGFNSKSAFYNAFKKMEGTTPSRFKKSLK